MPDRTQETFGVFKKTGTEEMPRFIPATAAPVPSSAQWVVRLFPGDCSKELKRSDVMPRQCTYNLRTDKVVINWFPPRNEFRWNQVRLGCEH